MKLILLLILFVPINSFAQSGLSGNYLNLNPTALPTYCSQGELRFSSGTSTLNVCSQTNTWSLPGFANPMSTTGDLIFSSNNSGSASRLGIGASSSVLTVVGGLPSWQPNPTPVPISYPISLLNGGTGVAAGSSTAAFNALSPMSTAGDIIYENASLNPTRLGIGSSNNSILVSSGLPIWGAVPLASAGAVSGQLPLANGGTSINAGSTTALFSALAPATNAGDLLYENSSATGITRLGIGSSGSTLTVVGGTPAWTGAAALGSTTYAQAYFSNASYWNTTSTSYVDPTNQAAGTFNVRQSSGITLTAASSNLPGITFTPASSSAVYLITASFTMYDSAVAGGSPSVRMTDGTTVISDAATANQAATAPDVVWPATLSGIYVPGTTSSVTVKLQLATSSGTASLGVGAGVVANGLSQSVEWTVVQINPPTLTGSVGAYANAYMASGTTWLETGSTTFVDPTNSGGNALTVRKSSNLTLTAAASSLAGVSWTPSSSSAVYLVSAIFTANWSSTGQNQSYQLIDGSGTVIASSSSNMVGSNPTISLQGVYVPGTGSAVTTKIQLASSSGNLSIGANGSLGNSIEWSIVQINPPPIGIIALGSGGTGVAAGSSTAAFNALSPMSTAGDIIYENASLNPVRLGVGSGGSILSVVGGIPAWSGGFAARYHGTASALTASLNTIAFTTKDFDISQNGSEYSSGIYTCPQTGQYEVHAGINSTGATVAVTTTVTMAIFVNGASYSQNALWPYTAATSKPATAFINDIVSCTAGQTVCIQASSNATTPSITASNPLNYFSISLIH